MSHSPIVLHSGLMFNFSTSRDFFISENIGTFTNLSIIKIGQNEPDVTINIDVLTTPRGNALWHGTF